MLLPDRYRRGTECLSVTPVRGPKAAKRAAKTYRRNNKSPSLQILFLLQWVDALSWNFYVELRLPLWCNVHKLQGGKVIYADVSRVDWTNPTRVMCRMTLFGKQRMIGCLMSDNRTSCRGASTGSIDQIGSFPMQVDDFTGL